MTHVHVMSRFPVQVGQAHSCQPQLPPHMARPPPAGWISLIQHTYLLFIILYFFQTGAIGTLLQLYQASMGGSSGSTDVQTYDLNISVQNNRWMDKVIIQPWQDPDPQITLLHGRQKDAGTASYSRVSGFLCFLACRFQIIPGFLLFFILQLL